MAPSLAFFIAAGHGRCYETNMLRNKIVSKWIGRETDVHQVWKELESRSFLLVGPRRIGKTELLKHLVSHPAGGWKVLRIDVQAAQTTEDGLARIHDALDRVGLGTSVTEGVAALLAYQEAGGSPHWIHWLAGRCSIHAAADGAAPGVTDDSVRRALSDLEHPRKGRDLFDDEGRVHLKKYYGQQGAEVMSAVLDAAAASEGGLTEAQAQSAAQQAMRIPDRSRAREYVHALIDAWYLDQNPQGGLDFVNPLFRRWWRRFGGAS